MRDVSMYPEAGPPRARPGTQRQPGKDGGRGGVARVRYILATSLPWLLLAATIGLWSVAAVSAPGAFELGERAGRNLWEFSLEMALVLPAMFVLVGLFDVWVPRTVIERHLGRESGPLAILWMVLLGMLQAGPLYAAFPVAVALWRKGSAPRNVFIYLFSFCAIKIPMLTFEVGFLGWQFSLVRTAVTLPVFIGLAYLLEWLLPDDATIPGAPVNADPAVSDRRGLAQEGSGAG